MKRAKGDLIKNIRDGQHVEGLFLVKEMSRAETRTGSPYLVLTVMDETGELGGRVWENADMLMPECPPGGIISLTGQAQAYRNILQLKINRIKAVPETEVDMSLFVPSTPGDIDAMAAELEQLAKSVTDPDLQELVLAFLKDNQFFEKFCKAPAAKSMHHAYLGGLLEHTLAVSRLADMTTRLYPSIDRSLLIAGAILHDIGKVSEFSYALYPFDYSDQGRLVGHHVLGSDLVQEKINALKKFPEKLGTRLKHLILSHHGRHEFGSPALPMMREAFILNFLDDLDAKINYVDRLGKQALESGYQWTEYQRTLERFLFVKGSADEPPQDPVPEGTAMLETPESQNSRPQNRVPKAKSKNMSDTRQRTLF